MTASHSTLQNCAIFLFISELIECSVRHIKISGCIPASNNVLTECCVGLVFNSLVAARKGTSVRCINSAFLSNSHFNCLTASINGSASISPTVPPISVITKLNFLVSPKS